MMTDQLNSLWTSGLDLKKRRSAELEKIAELYIQTQQFRDAVAKAEAKLDELRKAAELFSHLLDLNDRSIVSSQELPDGDYVVDYQNRKVVPSGSVSDSVDSDPVSDD